MLAGGRCQLDTPQLRTVASVHNRPEGGLPTHRHVRAAALDALVQDVRHAFRALRHARGHALWVIGSLCIGMAVMTAALALLNALLVRSFPAVADQDSLVRVAVSRNCGRPDCWQPMASAADYAALRHSVRNLRGLTGYIQADVPATFQEAQSIRAIFASDNYFDVLGVGAAMGRVFDARDGRSQAPVAVVSHALWTARMGADPAAIGRSIRILDEMVEIVGVAPPAFGGIDLRPHRASAPDIWLPLWLTDRILPPGADGTLLLAGRLAAGSSVNAARHDVQVLASTLAGMYDPSLPSGRAEVYPVWMTRPGLRPITALIVLPIPILVLVIACVNAANLMLAHGSRRGREIAIRLAIGAGRTRIVRQLLIESVLLALAATAAAVPLARWGLDLAESALGVPMPIDRTVLAAAIFTAAGTAIGFGLLPARRAAAQRPALLLGPGGGGSSAPPRESAARRALLGAQVALSLALLATGWQLVSTVRGQGGADSAPGDRLLIARFDLAPLRFSAAEAARFYERLLETSSRLPGVASAGLARHTAVWTFGRGAGPASLVVWHPGDKAGSRRAYIGGYAGGDLFDAVGVRLLAGRTFTVADRHGTPRVAIVNQAFAEALAGPAVGQTVRVAAREQADATPHDVQIVGVVESVMERRDIEDGRPRPKVYLPSPLGPETALALYVRPHASAALVGPPVRQLVREIDPRVPILEMGSLDEVRARSFDRQLWLARAAAVLGALGVLLATAGVYGVASYVVSMRSRELAIRLAIGAQPRRMLAMVMGDSLRVVAAGLTIGGLAAWIASRLIQAEYHGIVGMDIVAFGGSGALFATAMLIASGIPAVRAARLDPMDTLRDG